MRKKIIDINYVDLPKDFFEEVLLYEKVCPSGLLDEDDEVIMTLKNGKKYCVYLKELREGDYDRIIPFFKSMVNEGKSRWINYEEPPKGWSYFYCFHENYIMRQEIYNKYEKCIPEIKKIFNENDNSRFYWWHDKLEELLQEEYGMVIDQEEMYVIHMNELIRVFDSRYYSEQRSKCITVEELVDIPKEYLKKVIIYHLELRNGSRWVNGFEIELFTEDEPKYWIDGSIGKEKSEFDTEEAFAEAFSKFAPITYNEEKKQYAFEQPIENYIYYPIMDLNGWFECCWIRKDIYEKYYESVIVPLKNCRRTRPYFLGD